MEDVTKIYLSGPISGRREKDVAKHFNRVKWLLQYEALKAQANVMIISPAAISGLGLEWDSYMKIAQAIIEDPTLDAICLMKGWERSEGCKQELTLAMAKNLPIIFEPGASEDIRLQEGDE